MCKHLSIDNLYCFTEEAASENLFCSQFTGPKPPTTSEKSWYGTRLNHLPVLRRMRFA